MNTPVYWDIVEEMNQTLSHLTKEDIKVKEVSQKDIEKLVENVEPVITGDIPEAFMKLDFKPVEEKKNVDITYLNQAKENLFSAIQQAEVSNSAVDWGIVEEL